MTTIWVAIALSLTLLTLPGAAISQTPPSSGKTESNPKPPLRPLTTCPVDIESLSSALLRDLPEYINRLSHQQGGSQSQQYAIAASKANLTPLPITYTGTPNSPDSQLHQVFFTVLERQYENQRREDSQRYHWMILAYSPTTGWQLATLYTRATAYPANNQPPSRMQETSQQVIGRAIRRWLRDCRAGVIKALE
jgi:hypothetical protein